MAFSFAGVAPSTADGNDSGGVRVQDGEELQEIQTDQLGFCSLKGEAKVRLLSTPWPDDNLPSPSASLLSIASSYGLTAAASPNELVIVQADKIREKIYGDEQENVRSLDPYLTISHSRLSQVAFASDDSCLAVTEQDAGQILVYSTTDLLERKKEHALQLAINGSLRALVPNPALELAQFFAIITNNGELHIADFSAGTLVQGSNGSVLAENVSCLSWSNKGKQLVVGLADGTALQLWPDGRIVARIPKSTSIPSDHYVSGISWLENDLFFIVYTSGSTSAEDSIPEPVYYLVGRTGTPFTYTFQKLPEVIPPFGMERIPTSHFVSRLRGFKPHLQDLLIVSATSSTDVGFVSKSEVSLSTEIDVVNAFTVTKVAEDSRRAQLPLSSGDLPDTSPIGMALDFSAKEGIIKPIPNNPEIEQSSTPVPELMLLNQEGVLCVWGIVYNESVLQGIAHPRFELVQHLKRQQAVSSTQTDVMDDGPVEPSLSTVSTQTSQPSASATESPFAKPTLSSVGQSGFGFGSGFGKPTPLGGETKTSWAASGFGGASSSQNATMPQPTFGTSSGLGAVENPTFGQTGTNTGKKPAQSTPTPAFGQSGFAAQASTPSFGQAGFGGQTKSPAFGQSSFGAPASGSKAFMSTSSTTASPFASSAQPSKPSGFSSFASGGGFGSVQNTASSESPFAAKPSSGSIFGQSTSQSQSPFAPVGQPASQPSFVQSKQPSIFGQSQPQNTFGAEKSQPAKTPFGVPSQGFKLESSFKGDGSAKDDLPKPTGSTGFSFGNGFSNLLNETKDEIPQAQSKEEEMSDDAESPAAAQNESDHDSDSMRENNTKSGKLSVVTPPSTISQSKATPAPPVSNLFGTTPQNSSKTPTAQTGPSAWSFNNFPSTTPKDTPAPSKILFGTKPVSETTPALVSTSEPINTFAPLPVVPSKANESPSTKLSAQSESGEGSRADPPEPPLPPNPFKKPAQVSAPPLPPDPFIKPSLQAGDTAGSSANSTSKAGDKDTVSEDRPGDGEPTGQLEAELEGPSEEDDDDNGDVDDFSEFSGSGEDVTDDLSRSDEQTESKTEREDHTEPLETSPESISERGSEKAPMNSLTGGPFTKVSTKEPAKGGRALFGEVGTGGPIFPPPKPQESPRSPSPVRKPAPGDLLRSPDQSVGAPTREKSVISQRKEEFLQSPMAAQALQARQLEAAKEQGRREALRRAQEEALAREQEILQDDEDDILQEELSKPVEPTEWLDPLITHQFAPLLEPNRSDIPAQIERLYQDINSMILTLGINARSLSAFMLYQKTGGNSEQWPSILESESVLDTLAEDWRLNDSSRLHEGHAVLARLSQDVEVSDVSVKLEQCHSLATEITGLRIKVTSLRKSLHAATDPMNAATAPLSAEQASIQYELRRASATVQTKMRQLEDNVALLRARLAEFGPPEPTSSRQSAFGSHKNQKKPTVEAVVNTVGKMTTMAERKSADLDVLEARLKKLDVSTSSPVRNAQSQTPDRRQTTSTANTPGSAGSSVYQTPGSRAPGSVRSTPLRNQLGVVSANDREAWKAKSQKKKAVASVLKAVLEERRDKTSRTGSLSGIKTWMV